MPHPKDGYRLASGLKVPGTTQIIGRYKDSGALIRWAYNRGKEGLDLYDSRDKAADVGSVAHAMVEAKIAGLAPYEVPELKLLDDGGQLQAQNAYDNYREWAQGSKLEIVAQEMQLVSEKYRFGGTPDAIGSINGELCLVDWKTSNGVYSDYLLQLAAYRILWEENNPDQPLTGGFHLCRFAKDHGDFSHHFYRELEAARKSFLYLRAAFEFDAELKRRAA